MIARLLSLSLVFLSVSPTFARVGDNWEQCIARYGKPIDKKVGPSPNMETGYFQVSAYLYTVRFFERRASLVSITRLSADGKSVPVDLTEAEITKHLRENGGPRQWTSVEPPPPPTDRAWKTADASMHATYYDKTLVVLTVAHAARTRAAKAAAAQPK
jgi:hypothetical protein